MKGLTMAKTPTAESTALTVPERILLFCLASGTDWQAASITHATAQQMIVRGLIEGERERPLMPPLARPLASDDARQHAGAGRALALRELLGVPSRRGARRRPLA
jgi:hypothetical protein